jgi:hypothetical protein
MKKTQMVSAGIAFVLAITFTSHAQEMAMPVQAGIISPTDATVEDVRSMSDLEVMLKAVEATTPLSAAAVPESGNFYSAQNPDWPPLPGNIDKVPCWPLDTNMFLLDDRAVNYAAPLKQTVKAGKMMALDAPFPGGDGGGSTNSYSPSYLTPVDYGTNLWIAKFAVTSSNAVGTLSNSLADVLYEVQYKNDLTSPQWLSTGFFILGSELTNWTAMSLPGVSLTNNAFFRIRSWASSDGSGLPDWWELEYFGTTGINPNAQDPAGDGWSNWQKFQMGLNPNVFYTPPAPQGVTVNYNANNGSVSINWQLSPGPVTGYTMEKDVDNWYYGQTIQDFSVSGANAYSDTVSPATLGPYDGGGNIVSYRVQAHYAGGDSSWSDSAPLEPNTITANFTTGPQGSAYVTTSPLPSGTTALQVTLVDEAAWFYYLLFGIGSEPVNPTFTIPVTNPGLAQYLIPATNAVVPPSPDGGSYFWYVQTETTNGNLGAPYLTTFGSDSAAPPYADGRAQLKQNLIFLLRAAMVDSPFQYIEVNTNTRDYYSFANPPNYVYAGFYQLDEIANGGPFFEENVGSFDAYWPFENNYRYRNFVLNSTNLDSNGHITTGAGGDYYYNYFPAWGGDYPGGLMLAAPSAFQFQPPATNGATIPAVLATNSSRWLASYALDSASYYLWKIGATNYGNAYGLFSNVRNWFGLPFLSANLSGTTTLNAGNTTTAQGYFYPETAQPLFQTAAYDFWTRSPVPGSSGFSTTNTSDVLLDSVGNSITVNGYAKLAVLNGYSGVYGYLGQYFDQAYQVNTNGNITTNRTGILSPYGNFFATVPGQAALVTMPDIDTGARGTGIVSCISVNLNASHSGGMDLSFNGPDVTSASSPYVFWTDQNFDRLYYDADDSTNYEDDVKSASNPGTSVPQPDCNYSNRLANGYSYRAIPTKRDLEDFTRLWVCGITTNLLAALPSGSTVTLSWADDWNYYPNPQSHNPTIDLFTAADADGGIGYLTNETVAAIQTNNFQCPYIGRLGPGGSIQLNTIQFANGWAGNHFIWCGVSNGTGGLNLTIADGSGNVLAQSTAYIQIVDIKQMYERWTVGDNPANAPTNTATLVTDGLAAGVPGFQYTTPTDTNTPYILFVHGWNMEPWEKDRFAETAFKRLYWQGYHGRFGEFRWPTSWGFTGDFSQLFFNQQMKDNFDNSEYFAWLSGTGLLNKLSDLNTKYPSRVYMLAHSMGNIVTGEALRLAGNNRVVNTYVASQAAVTAHTCDTNIANYSFTVTYGSSQFNFGPHTPNIYGNWFAGNNGGGAGHVINFYNANDYALSRLHWQLDQLFKPDQVVATPITLWTYGYSGSANDPAPWNHFYKTNLLASASLVNFDIVNSLANRYEVMAYAAQAYTTALGATPGVLNLNRNVDLTRNSPTQIWPPDNSTTDPNKKYAVHFWHSAEFRGDYSPMQGYWSELLGAEAFNLK